VSGDDINCHSNTCARLEGLDLRTLAGVHSVNLAFSPMMANPETLPAVSTFVVKSMRAVLRSREFAVRYDASRACGKQERYIMTPESMTTSDAIFDWFVRDQHWARVGLPMAVILLLLSPLFAPALGVAAFLVFLQLPIYMLHQYEEHGHGAFKAFVNATRPLDAPPLSDRKIFWINILGVWVVDLVALFVARFGRSAYGLVAPYVAVVNGLLHIGMALRQRRYNPGLWTSLLLFIPIGGGAIVGISRACAASKRHHGIGLAGALLLHIITFASVFGFSFRIRR
jgi:hypothetical protein